MTILFVSLFLVGCTIYQPIPRPKVYNFSIRQFDPPIQDENDKVCIPIGLDGLACRDEGIRI